MNSFDEQMAQFVKEHEDDDDSDFINLCASNIRKDWIRENGYELENLQKAKLRTCIEGNDDLERQIDEEMNYENKK